VEGVTDTRAPGAVQEACATEDLARFAARLGLALIACGESVTGTHAALTRVAAAGGVTDCSFYTLPTGAIAVLRARDSLSVELAAEGARTLRLDQVQHVYDLLDDAEHGRVEPEDGLARLDGILAARPRYNPLVVIAGHGVATFGFALILQLAWPVVAVSVVLGLLAGALRLMGTRVHRLEILRPVLVSFVCGCVVFLLARDGTVDAPYHALIPPLLLSLPFVPLTLATLELADRQMVSGATRLAYALVQIVLLVFGLLAAQQLVDIPPSLALADGSGDLGWWAAWVGTLIFALGVALHFSAPLKTLPWLLAVCLAARVGLALGQLAGSVYLAAMIGAVLMAVVADWSAAHTSGPPRLVTFSPTFILLIPGALAITGLTQIFGPERALAFADLSQAMFIIVAIAVGLMVGLGLYEAGARLAHPGGRAGSDA
jgi:uncharacterized membrane protein YjjP (DUF1212 family)